MTTDNIYMLCDDDGTPAGMVDLDAIESTATVLAYRMADACDDPARLDAITTQAITEQGSDGFGYVAAAALRITIEHLLAPTLAVTDAAGIDLRTALHEGTRNAEHQAGHHN